MGLAEDIAAEAPNTRREMRVDQILRDLDDTDEKVLREALADPKIPHSQITRALNKNGHSVSAGSVQAWRERHGTG